MPKTLDVNDMAEVELQLKRLELEEKLEKRRLDSDKKDQLAREQEAKLLQIQKRRQEELNFQSNCSHKKPNGQAALVGQHDGANNLHLFCSFCMKQYNHRQDIPIDLASTIRWGSVGGGIVSLSE